jgi:hypothetical protein
MDVVSDRAFRSLALLFFAAALFVYLYGLPYRIWGAGGDTTPAEMLPLAIFHGDGLYFDAFASKNELPYWFTSAGNHIISSYPIVPGLLNVPVYAISLAQGVPLDQIHRSLLSVISASIIAAASVAFLFLVITRLTAQRSTAVLATFIYAFGTTVYSVAARGMWQHGPSLLFLTSGLWLLTLSGRWSVPAAAIPLGLAVWNRPLNMLLVAPLAVYVFWKHRRDFPLFAALALIPGAAMAWYAVSYWGSIATLGQYPVHGRFNGDFLVGLAGLLFNPSRGLFIFTPLFIFSLVPIWQAIRHPFRDPLMTALASGVILTLLTYAKWDMWWGGSTFGYRLLTELAPSLTIFFARGWETWLRNRRMSIVAVVVTGLVSLYVHVLGAVFYPCGFDAIPNEINHHTERLWSVRESELARCSSKFASRLQSHLN